MKRHFTLLFSAFVIAILFSLGNKTFAAVTVTPASGGTGICSNTAADGIAPAYTPLGVVTITEGMVNDFGFGTGTWNIALTLTLPAGWSYNTAAVPVLGGFTPGPGSDITAATIPGGGFTATILTINISGPTRTNLDVITITGLQVRPNNTYSASGNITGGGFTPGFNMSNCGPLSLNPLPIVGTRAACVGSVTNLTDLTVGGAWTSGNTTLATVSGIGAVTGVAVGVVNIDYTVAGCITTFSLTVRTPPSLISGPSVVCAGSTINISNTVAGGTWTSGTPAVATVAVVPPNIVVGGVPTVATVSTSVITYSVAACPAAVMTVTVNPRPAIGGPATICVGGSITLSNNLVGGTWSSANSAVATVVSGTGAVGGGTAGNAPISYVITATGCSRTTTVTVNAPPGTITGLNSVCTGANITLSNTPLGGVWSSSNSSVATIVPASGVLRGVLGGTTSISYSVTACPASAGYTVTVVTTPLAISGATGVCRTFSIMLSSATPGGVWTSSNTTLATVSGSAAGGSVTGVTSGGPVNINYANGACSVSYAVTVFTQPVAITGTTALCTGTTTTYTNTTGGGTWSSSNSSVATIVSGSGLLSGTTAGTTVIAYTRPSGCQAVMTVTVNQTPGPITGNMFVCIGEVTTLSDAPAGGTWTSATSSVATVDPGTGDVTGVIAGSSIITFHEPIAGCITTATVNVVATPTTIIGLSSVCEGATITLSNTSIGGTWSSDNSSAATIDPVTGIVSGVAAGVTNITYDFGSTCFASTSVTVNPLAVPGVILGPGTVCQGGTTPLSNATLGGVWTSSNTTLATVSSTGVVRGVLAGPVNILYTVTNGCGPVFTSHAMTVDNFIPDVVVTPDANPSCLGTPVTYTATPTFGGTTPAYQWRVNGVTSSVTNPFTYTPLNGDIVICRLTSNQVCAATTMVYDTVTMVVNPNLPPSVNILSDIYGDTVCIGTLTQYTATPVNGGATPAYLWMVNGVPGPGANTTNPYLYTPSDDDIVSCELTSSYACALPAAVMSNSITMTVDVTEVPAVNITASANPSCEGSPVTYTAHTLYGGIAPFIRWTQNSVNVATGPMYTTIPANGDQIYCILKSSQTCRTADSVFSTPNPLIQVVEIPIMPVVNIISKHSVLTVGQHDTLSAIVTPVSITPTYQWYLSGVAIAGATNGTYVVNTSAPAVQYYYCIVGNGNVCNTTKISGLVTINVYAVGVKDLSSESFDLKLVPNPNTGVFTVEGNISSNKDVTIEIMNAIGQVVYKGVAPVQNETLNQQISLGGDVANGVYMLHVITNNAHKVIRFTLSR